MRLNGPLRTSVAPESIDRVTGTLSPRNGLETVHARALLSKHPDLHILGAPPATLLAPTLTRRVHMYISLAWKPVNGADPATVEAALDQILAQRNFSNVFKPYDHYLLANVPGNKKSPIDDLQMALRALDMSFTITATQRGWTMWRSKDVSEQKCEEICDAN